MKQFNRSLAAVFLCCLAAAVAPGSAAAAGSSGSTFKTIDTGHSVIKTPVFPGAHNDATKHMSIDDGTGMYSIEGYTTHASVKAVYGWYAARLSSWSPKLLSYNGHDTGVLKFQNAKVEQSILIGSQNGLTNITLTEKDKH